MIRPDLKRISAQVRARLQSGEALTWRDVWAMAPDASRSWACERWRTANPEKVAIARKRDVFKRRRSPILDPITAAMLGYTRRGTGWVKKNPASTSQEAPQ